MCVMVGWLGGVTAEWMDCFKDHCVPRYTHSSLSVTTLAGGEFGHGYHFDWLIL